MGLDLSRPQIEALQATVESIDREAKSLPMRHSDLFFDFIIHADLMRARVATRLASVNGSICDDRPAG
jgi:hypothetical protein